MTKEEFLKQEIEKSEKNFECFNMSKEQILKQEIKQAELDINFYTERLEKTKLLLEVLKKEQENLTK